MGYTSRKRTWPGDSIVEVNGVRGDVANMLQKCKVIPSMIEIRKPPEMYIIVDSG